MIKPLGNIVLKKVNMFTRLLILINLLWKDEFQDAVFLWLLSIFFCLTYDSADLCFG